MITVENNRPTYSLLALGDSYTIGEGVEQAASWPYLLSERLESAESITLLPEVVARTGWTTSDLLNGIERQALATYYDVVSLLIGVNNQYRGLGLESYRSELLQLVEIAVALANNKRSSVVIVSIPDWGISPFEKDRDKEQVGREIDQYNHVNRSLAEEFGLRYVDVTGVSRTCSDRPLYFAADGLHPSGDQYELWIEPIVPVVKDMLKTGQ